MRRGIMIFSIKFDQFTLDADENHEKFIKFCIKYYIYNPTEIFLMIKIGTRCKHDNEHPIKWKYLRRMKAVEIKFCWLLELNSNAKYEKCLIFTSVY